MKQNNSLQVFYGERLVGTLAITARQKVAFQYSEEWIENGFPISPFTLPLKKDVFVPTKDYFQGLFGVFADSLPDNWGRLLLNRMLKSHKINIDELTVLDRLAIVGKSGMGALTYYPEREFEEREHSLNLDELAVQCQKILNTEYSDKLDELYRLGGTSGGARPKIMTTIDNEQWIIKFPTHVDGENAGKMEYDYSCCAKQCGITMSETRLFPSEKCKGYFGTKRFDRISDETGEKRIHMLTAAALLELDYEQQSLDYDEDNDMWHLSPAYDLTYSNTYYGEHTTSVDGNGRNPGKKELLAVGMRADISKEKCVEIMEMIESTVKEMLGRYL